jgi:hypothetical protein
MNKLRPLFVTFALLMLTLLPLQAVQAQGLGLPNRGGGVVIGSSYVLQDGETLSGGLVVIGGSALLESGSSFYGDLVVIGGSATLEEGAQVNGAVVTIGGSLSVDTEVKGDVVSIGGPTLLEENTHIRGDLVTIGGPVQRTEGARIDGQLVDNPTAPTRPDQPAINIPAVPVVNSRFDFLNPFWDAFWLLMRSIGYGLLAGLIVLFLPEHTRRVSEAAMRQPLRTSGMGLLTYILFVVVIVALGLFSLLLITLILTIPLMAVVVLLLGAGMAFGWIALGTEVGVRLVGLFKRELPLPASAVLGTFLLTLVSGLCTSDFIVCVGWMVPFFLTILGVGAVAVTRFGTQAVSIMAGQAEVEYVPPVDTP